MKQTRLKVILFFGVVIAILCGVAMFRDMESVSVVLAGSLGAIVAKYTHDETKRKSIK
jgi:hypothetical protein